MASFFFTSPADQRTQVRLLFLCAKTSNIQLGD